MQLTTNSSSLDEWLRAGAKGYSHKAVILGVPRTCAKHEATDSEVIKAVEGAAMT